MTYEESRRTLTAEVRRSAFLMAVKMCNLGNNQLAHKAGVSPATVSNIRTGKAARCNPETAGKIARALGVEVHDIFLIRSLQSPATRHAMSA